MLNKNEKVLILVESPAKARTLSKILPNNFIIRASYGHIMELPKNNLGFDPDDNFKPKPIELY